MKRYITKKGTEIRCDKLGVANVYFIRNDTAEIIVDSGISSKWHILEDKIFKEKINIKYIILTHAHYDHCGNTAMIKRQSGAELIAHENSVPILKKGYSDVPAGTNLFSRILTSFYDKIVTKYPKWESVYPDTTFKREYYLQENGLDARLIHTPGHTNDSISVILDDEVSFVGDTMFGIFRNTAMPPFANDVNLLFRSWERLLATNTIMFFPGHGNPIKRDILEKTLSRKVRN